jgi:hypothetical protein
MKISFCAITLFVVTSCAEKSVEKPSNKASVIASGSTLASAVAPEKGINEASNANHSTAPNQAAANKRNVRFFYDKYANIDSEDPEIGVGPRTIVSENTAAGIIEYKENGSTKIQKIQHWPRNGYDIIEYPGGLLFINGSNAINVYLSKAVTSLVKKTIDNRTARGGECEYNNTPIIKVGNKVTIVLTCMDDRAYSQTIGYADFKNGAVIVTQ